MQIQHHSKVGVEFWLYAGRHVGGSLILEMAHIFPTSTLETPCPTAPPQLSLFSPESLTAMPRMLVEEG